MKRLEDLENQVFGQQLVIDELNSKLETTQKDLEGVRADPFGLSKVTYTSGTYIPPAAHTCTYGYPDYFGNSTCTVCGQMFYGVMTYTSNTSTPEDSITENIEITWDDKD